MKANPLRETLDARAPGDSLAPRHAYRVVIAEEEAPAAERLERMVVHLGHTVVGRAQNGMQVLERVRELGPDVVIIDLRMPLQDGWTTMTELTRGMLAPVVVVSARGDRESLEQAAAAGASAFLTQPVREDELERALALTLARSADAQEIRAWRAAAEARAREQARQKQELEQVIQELRETQLQLVNAARRAAVAGLAHGLAHEINNALTPIIGHAQMITVLYPQDRELLQRANAIIEHARRIAGWTASFRQVTLGGSRARIAFSFNGVVRDVVGLYAERFQRLGITAQLHLDDQAPVLYGHPDQIQEVLMNVIQNAVDAMGQGGSLKVVTQYDPAAQTVRAALTDTGSGIPAQDLAFVFEPGFTTKASASHSLALGWGLFTVQQILKAHGGKIEIASPPPGERTGTAVEITLSAKPEGPP